MNQKLLISSLFAMTTLVSAPNAFAQPQYVLPTGATGCSDCHLNSLGSGYKSEVITIATTAISYTDKMNRLTTFVQSLKTPVVTPPVTTTDTAPVLSLVSKKWNITVGEVPLSIPFLVKDAEKDTFDVHGSIQSGMTVTSITTDPIKALPTFSLNWTPTAAQAGINYPVSVYVRETGTGRTLSSRTVKTEVKVWPARTNALFAKVSQFSLQKAKFLKKKNRLQLGGQVIFKPTATLTERNTVLATVAMAVQSQLGAVVSTPLKLKLNAKGNWSKVLNLTATQVPCTVVVEFEGLKAENKVVGAAATTCRK
jgi:hypothetical protein